MTCYFKGHFAPLRREKASLHHMMLPVIVVSLFALSGCGSPAARAIGMGNWGYWPPEGSGGYGEMLHVDDARLAEQIEVTEILRLRGAARFAAANLYEADSLIMRAKRELHAGLWTDAVIDMDKIEEQLRIIAKRMPQARNPLPLGATK